ncbi:MAG: hypothetical protein ABI591_25175 [Kofleriaceae bacterium]
MFLDAVIVFVGIAGNHHQAVEHQLGPVLDHAGVNELVVPAADLAAIVRHSDASRDVVKNLHVDGVVGGALVTSGGRQAFRLVIYDGKGNMRSLGETPLAGHKLTVEDLEVLGINLAEEVTSLQPATAPHVTLAVAHNAPAPVRPIPAAPPARVASTPPARTPEPEIVMDAPEPPAPAPKQVADASAVSLDEIEAMTGGDDATGGGSVAETATVRAAADSTLHLHVDAGLGMTGRAFSAPAGVTGYSSSPVSTVHFAAGIAPTERTSIDVAAERTISMSTSLDSGSASTMISRWQVGGGLALIDSSVKITANLGLGHRAFTIDATETGGRTPDSEYNYVALGARIAKPLGTSATLRGLVELEPVFGGADAMQMSLGSSSRWGLDVGAAFDYALSAHFIASAAFDFQRFSWSWNAAGARAATGASDSYPTATLALRSAF